MSIVRVPIPSLDDVVSAAQKQLFERNRQLNEAEARERKLKEDLRHAEEDLQQERNRNRALEAGVSSLRSILAPLHSALGMIFGEIEAVGLRDDPTPASAPGAAPATATGPDARLSAIWASWKSKLPSGEAKAVDALLLHGSMTTAQLRIHVGCASRTAQNIVQALNKKGLVQKDSSGKVSLKDL